MDCHHLGISILSKMLCGSNTYTMYFILYGHMSITISAMKQLWSHCECLIHKHYLLVNKLWWLLFPIKPNNYAPCRNRDKHFNNIIQWNIVIIWLTNNERMHSLLTSEVDLNPNVRRLDGINSHKLRCSDERMYGVTRLCCCLFKRMPYIRKCIRHVPILFHQPVMRLVMGGVKYLSQRCPVTLG